MKASDLLQAAHEDESLEFEDHLVSIAENTLGREEAEWVVRELRMTSVDLLRALGERELGDRGERLLMALVVEVVISTRHG